MSEASPWESTMRIGILGSGLMGGKLGTIFARAGHEVVFSYARSEQKLKRLARGAQGNARAGTPEEAALGAGAEELARKVRRAHVVSAFGTVPSEVLFPVFETKRKAKRPSLLFCGDDQGA